MWASNRMSDLRRFWPQLLSEHTDLLDRLLAAYADPGRGYHDTRHLVEVLERIDVLLAAESGAGVDANALSLAVWFHDAVYDHEGQNEERSATLAERELATAGIPPLVVAEVARLVRLTQTHRPDENDQAGKILVDADLAILAADEVRYAEYVSGVRQEYAAVSDDDFRVGRAEVLRRLLESQTMFSTSFARQRWEEPARRNVERELEELTGISAN